MTWALERAPNPRVIRYHQVARYRSEIDEYVRRSEENLKEFADLQRTLDAGEPLEIERNDELASQFIRALEGGSEVERRSRAVGAAYCFGISFFGSQCGISTTTAPTFAVGVSTSSAVPSSVCSIGSIAYPMFFSRRGE